MKITIEQSRIFMVSLDIEESQKHPYTDAMAAYHWNLNLPFVYRNRQGDLVQQWADGRIEYLVDEESDTEMFDKRYDTPFEDDGAYAEDEN